MAIEASKIYELLEQIPIGKVSTYKQLGLALNSKAYRAIGQIVKRNPSLPKVPCHRIVKSDGSLGGYVLGQDKKTALLRKEGLEIVDDRIVDFKNKLFCFKKISQAV